MSDELVSVIIPIYNVEKYLKACIDSILNQTYKNLEIILVDDGSPDNCGKICDEYSEKDSRVKVIHKENGGLSDARNFGIEASTGGIISFIDSDDYISPYFYEIMLLVMEKTNCDVVALKGGIDFWDGDVEPALALTNSDFKYKAYNSNDVLKLMFYQRIATGAPFKIYKRYIWANIRFPYGYLYEDVATTYKTFILSNQVCVVDSKLYAYRKRQDSIIRRKFNEKKLICLKISEQLLDDVNKYDDGLMAAAKSRTFAMIFSVFLQVPKEDKKTQQKLWNELKKMRNTVVFDKNNFIRKKNKYGAIAMLFGMNFTYWLGRKFGQRSSMK